MTPAAPQVGAARSVFFGHGKGVCVELGQKAVHGEGKLFRPVEQAPGLAPDAQRARQFAGGRKTAAHAVVHGVHDVFELLENGRAAHAGNGGFVFQNELMQGEARSGQLGAQFAHGAVGVDGLAPFRRRPALPLNEAAAHGIVFHFKQGVVVRVAQGGPQGIAVGGVVQHGAEDHVGEPHAQAFAADADLVACFGIAGERGQHLGGAGFGSGPQQTGQHGGVGAVADAGGAEGAQQFHTQGGGLRHRVFRQGAAAFKEVITGLHWADGMGAGGAWADFEEVEQGRFNGRPGSLQGLQVGLRHGGLRKSRAPGAGTLGKRESERGGWPPFRQDFGSFSV